MLLTFFCAATLKFLLAQDSISASKSNSISKNVLIKDTSKAKKNIEIIPEFPNGEHALLEFIALNVHYPKKSRRKGFQGKVVAKLTIHKEGNLKNIGIVKGLEDMCNKKVMRVIQSMPKWKPGYQDGKAVDCSYMLPVMFTLED